MADAAVKNAWDLLARVRQRLAAGESRVVFRLTPAPDAPDGPLDYAHDEQGTTYDLTGDLLDLFQATRTAFISYALSRRPGEPATLSFGDLPRRPHHPGDLLLDLRGHQVDIREEFNPDNPAAPLLRIDATAPPTNDDEGFYPPDNEADDENPEDS